MSFGTHYSSLRWTLIVLLCSCTPQGAIGPDGQLVGVDGDGNPVGDEDDHPAGPLNPDTLTIEDHPCFDYAEVLTDDRSELALHYTCDAGPDELEAGKIVWGLDDGGYLRRIQTVQVEGTTAWLTTEFASLAEAVTDIDFDEDIDLSDAREVVDFSGRVLDDVEVDGGRSTVTVNTGTLNMQPSINARGSFGFLRLKSVTSRNRVTIDIDMETAFHSDGATDRAQLVELTTLSKPFTLKVGPVRVRGRLDSVVKIGFVHNSDGPIDATTRFTGNGVIDMGGTYYMPNNWQPSWNPSFNGSVTELQPTGDSDWNGKVYIVVEGKVTLNGNPGGTSTYGLTSEGSTTSDCDGIAWSTTGGLGGQTTMRLRFMGRSVDHDFPPLDFQADAKSGTIEHETPPPGCLGDDEFGICEPVATLTCGQSIGGDTSSAAQAVAAMDAYPCNVGNYDSPEIVYSWTATTSTAEFALIDAEPTEINHDLFVLDGAGGTCTAAECVAHGFNSVEFDAVPGRTYYLVVDGFYEEMGPFQAELRCD